MVKHRYHFHFRCAHRCSHIKNWNQFIHPVFYCKPARKEANSRHNFIIPDQIYRISIDFQRRSDKKWHKKSGSEKIKKYYQPLTISAKNDSALIMGEWISHQIISLLSFPSWPTNPRGDRGCCGKVMKSSSISTPLRGNMGRKL